MYRVPYIERVAPAGRLNPDNGTWGEERVSAFHPVNDYIWLLFKPPARKFADGLLQRQEFPMKRESHQVMQL